MKPLSLKDIERLDAARKYVSAVIVALLENRVHSAVKYVSPSLVVRGTRRLVKGKTIDGREKVEVVLTIGSPNYRERDFVKSCKKAGESFPVRKIVLKYPPKSKKK